MAAIFVAGGASTYQQLKGTLRLDHAIRSLGGAAIPVQHPQFSPFDHVMSVVKMPPDSRSLIEYAPSVMPFGFTGNTFTPPNIFWWPTTSNPGDVVFRVGIQVFSVESPTTNIVSMLFGPVTVPAGKEMAGVVTVPTGFPIPFNPGDPNTIYLCFVVREGADAGDTYPDDILIGHAYTDLVIP